MKRHKLLEIVAVFGVLSMMVSSQFARRTRRSRPLFRRVCSRRPGQRPTRFRAQSMSSALL